MAIRSSGYRLSILIGLSAMADWLSGYRVIGFRDLAIGYRLSTIGYRLSAIDHRLSTIGYRPSVIGYRLSAIGDRVIGERAIGDSRLSVRRRNTFPVVVGLSWAADWERRDERQRERGAKGAQRVEPRCESASQRASQRGDGRQVDPRADGATRSSGGSLGCRPRQANREQGIGDRPATSGQPRTEPRPSGRRPQAGTTRRNDWRRGPV